MMRKTVGNIARIIDSGGDVALYGASPQAMQIIHALQKGYGIAPRCVVDSDIDIHGKKMQSLQILSLAQALQKWPNLQFFCAAPLVHAAIVGNLLEKGIPEARILNYEPVERYVGCPELEAYCVMTPHTLHFCCKTGELPFIPNTSQFCCETGEFPLIPLVEGQTLPDKGDYPSIVNEMSLLRKKIITNLRNGNSTICDGCQRLNEGYHFVKKRIRALNISVHERCNFKCQYCLQRKVDFGDSRLDYVEFASTLLESLPDLPLDIAPGEIVIHPKRQSIYKLAEDRSAKIYTNASLYDTGLAELLAGGFATLVVSLDAGTRKTFAAVKGVDFFERVRDNLRGYRAACDCPNMVLKYIFMPGQNDNPDDVHGFAEVCEELTPVSVDISYNMHASKTLEPETIQAMKTLYTRLDVSGIITHLRLIPYEYVQSIRG
jgi:pyruvate-formate lyase-activating enzyme